MLDGQNPAIQSLIRKRIVDLKQVRETRQAQRTEGEQRQMLYAMKEAIQSMAVIAVCLPQERFITTSEAQAIGHLMDYASLKSEVSRWRIERDLCRMFDLQDWDDLTGDQYLPAIAYLRGYLEI